MEPYPVSFSVDYPDRPLNRASSAFRLFTIIPIAIVIGLLEHANASYRSGGSNDTWFMPIAPPVETCTIISGASARMAATVSR